MKSKWEGRYAHSSSTSSISKLQFGGTKDGCVAAMSTPRTEALGYLSAMSIAHIPVPVPRSKIREFASQKVESGIGAA